MAQNQIKKTKPSALKMAHAKTQPGKSRVIKPKKAALQKVEKMKKKHSAGLIAATERTLAGRAGHLELLGGKKNKAEEKGRKGAVKGKG